MGANDPFHCVPASESRRLRPNRHQSRRRCTIAPLSRPFKYRSAPNRCAFRRSARSLSSKLAGPAEGKPAGLISQQIRVFGTEATRFG
jgi:hypothetical protein